MQRALGRAVTLVRCYSATAFLVLGIWVGCAFAAEPAGPDTVLFTEGPTLRSAIKLAFDDEFEGEEDTVIADQRAQVAAWPHEAGVYIAAAYSTDLGDSSLVDGPIEIHVAKLRREGGKLKRVAYGKQTFEGIRWGNSFSFDFAPYRLKTDEVAVGLRFHTSYSSTSYSSSWSELHLFRAVGAQMHEIMTTVVESSTLERDSSSFEAPMEETSGEQGDDQPVEASDPEENVLKAVVVIGKPGRDGFNDLIVKITEGRRAGDDAPLKNRKLHSETYRWNGKTYEAENSERR